jgi:hypothetical protein
MENIAESAINLEEKLRRNRINFKPGSRNLRRPPQPTNPKQAEREWTLRGNVYQLRT